MLPPLLRPHGASRCSSAGMLNVCGRIAPSSRYCTSEPCIDNQGPLPGMGGHSDRNGLFSGGFGEVELGTLASGEVQYKIDGSGILEDREGNHSRRDLKPAFQAPGHNITDSFSRIAYRSSSKVGLGAGVVPLPPLPPPLTVQPLLLCRRWRQAWRRLGGGAPVLLSIAGEAR